MASIVFDTYMKILREQARKQDTRDMRDPKAIGELLLKRAKGVSVLERANNLEAFRLPKYKG